MGWQKLLRFIITCKGRGTPFTSFTSLCGKHSTDLETTDLLWSRPPQSPSQWQQSLNCKDDRDALLFQKWHGVGLMTDMLWAVNLKSQRSGTMVNGGRQRYCVDSTPWKLGAICSATGQENLQNQPVPYTVTHIRNLGRKHTAPR